MTARFGDTLEVDAAIVKAASRLEGDGRPQTLTNFGMVLASSARIVRRHLTAIELEWSENPSEFGGPFD